MRGVVQSERNELNTIHNEVFHPMTCYEKKKALNTRSVLATGTITGLFITGLAASGSITAAADHHNPLPEGVESIDINNPLQDYNSRDYANALHALENTLNSRESSTEEYGDGSIEVETIEYNDGDTLINYEVSGELNDEGQARIAELEGTDNAYERPQYERNAYGSGWRTTDGISLRHQVLWRDFTDVEWNENRNIVAGSYVDPFLGGEERTFTTDDNLGSAVHIDHVLPVAQTWSDMHIRDREDRVDFYNYDMNLVALDGPENNRKGSLAPAEYMPPNQDIHCEYSVMWTHTSMAWDISLEDPDVTVLQDTLEQCIADALDAEDSTAIAASGSEDLTGWVEEAPQVEEGEPPVDEEEDEEPPADEDEDETPPADEEEDEAPTHADEYTPEYETTSVEAGEETEIAQTADLPEGTSFAFSEDFETPEGWEAIISPETGTVTLLASMDLEDGAEIEIPVLVSYPDGSSETVTLTATASVAADDEDDDDAADEDETPPAEDEEEATPPEDEDDADDDDADEEDEDVTDADRYNPEYEDIQAETGTETQAALHGDLPSGTTMDFSEEFDTPEGWDVIIDSEDGMLTIIASYDLQDGDQMEVPVLVSYPDGSSEVVVATVTAFVDEDPDEEDDEDDDAAEEEEEATPPADEDDDATSEDDDDAATDDDDDAAAEDDDAAAEDDDDAATEDDDDAAGGGSGGAAPATGGGDDADADAGSGDAGSGEKSEDRVNGGQTGNGADDGEYIDNSEDFADAEDAQEAPDVEVDAPDVDAPDAVVGVDEAPDTAIPADYSDAYSDDYADVVPADHSGGKPTLMETGILDGNNPSLWLALGAGALGLGAVAFSAFKLLRRQDA